MDDKSILEYVEWHRADLEHLWNIFDIIKGMTESKTFGKQDIKSVCELAMSAIDNWMDLSMREQKIVIEANILLGRNHNGNKEN